LWPVESIAFQQKGARMPFATCLIVMIGGAIGTLARFVVSVLALPISRDLPWGTIIINVTGSFVIGLFGIFTLADGRYQVPESIRLFVMVGLCGGYTTFSAFSLQTLDLMVLCICAVAAGHLVASHFNAGAKQIAQSTIEEES
jgi:CrcB protein